MPFAWLNIGPAEVIIVLAIGILLFGSRLPSIARSIGKSITEFKKGVKDVKEEVATDDVRKLEQKPDAGREIPAQKVESKSESTT